MSKNEIREKQKDVVTINLPTDYFDEMRIVRTRAHNISLKMNIRCENDHGVLTKKSNLSDCNVLSRQLIEFTVGLLLHN